MDLDSEADDLERTQRSRPTGLNCPNDTTPCPIAAPLLEMQRKVDRIAKEVTDIHAQIMTLVPRVLALEKMIPRASSLAEEAKRHAAEASAEAKRHAQDIREYVDSMATGAKAHASNVVTSLDDQSKALSEHGEILQKQNQAMAKQGEILSRLERAEVRREDRDEVLVKQSEALARLEKAEIRREAREEDLEKKEKSHDTWLMWGIPLALSVLQLVVLVVLYVARGR